MYPVGLGISRISTHYAQNFCAKTDTKCEGNLQGIQPFITCSLAFTLLKFKFESKGLARVLSGIGIFRVGGNEQGEPPASYR